ncbi:MAG: DUF3108 domain-containing protein [Candidatus Omnitrophica bacterium]|nr:DUF3108 domain-containing protein [Candidatus Omnitrophota bacterium]
MPKGKIALVLGLLFVALNIIILIAGLIFLGIRMNRKEAVVLKSASPEAESNLYAYLGERITYDIRFGGFRLGSSRFNYLAKAEINGRPALLMTLDTRLARFSDTEKIYGDPVTLLPLRIERYIINWFSREHIIENYDQSAHSVTIKKTKGKRAEAPLVIKKSGPIQNAILLPHYVRRLPVLTLGTVFTVNLPNREFKIELTSIDEVVVPAGTFKAFHCESIPRQIDIWITADERRIPVKIQGSGIFGYLMVMKEYVPPQGAS